jgi:soluble lytic murein transglycosylase-like protein
MSAHEPISAWLTTARQRALADAITEASDHAGVSSDVSLAVAVAESSLNAKAHSSDGLSSGTFQVTGPTATDIRRRIRDGEIDRPPGSDDVALGVAHLSWLHDIFGRDAALGGSLHTVPVDDASERTRFAVAAYNAGEGRVARAQERAADLHRDPTRYESIRAFLPATTQKYVDRVMRYSGRDTTTVRV